VIFSSDQKDQKNMTNELKSDLYPTPDPIAPPGVHEKVLELARALPGEACLDLPTGYGSIAERLLQAGKTVTAGDIDIEKYRGNRSHPRLRLVKLDLNEPQLPVPEGQFDIAVSVEGIEHLQSQWNFVRNLARALRPGGHLILTTPNILNIRSRLRYLMEGRYEHFKRPLVKDRSWVCDLDNYHIAPVSYFELQFMLECAGFSILSVHTNRYAAKNVVTWLLRPVFRSFYRHKGRRDQKRGRGDHDALYQTVMSEEIFYGECLIITVRKQDLNGR
jgi:SAM-dependent methyltransferase